MKAQGSAERLSDTLLTMDVVDELRHREAELKALSEKGVDDAGLKRRLAEIYRSQGIEVSDAILEAGIAAQRERRYVYVAPTGWKAWLARQWIERVAIGKRLAAGAASLLATMGLYQFAYRMPMDAFATHRIEAINEQVAAIEPGAAAAQKRHAAALQAVDAAVARIAASKTPDRLLQLKTDVLAEVRQADLKAQSALAAVMTLNVPKLVRADGETKLDGGQTNGKDPKEFVQTGIATASAMLAVASTATERVEAAASKMGAGVDASMLLDTANAAALAASLPEEAEKVRASEFAAGDAALRAGDVQAARTAAGKLDRLGADVAKLDSLIARLGTLREAGLVTGVSGEDKGSFEADLKRVEGLAHIATVDEAEAGVADIAAKVDLLAGDYTYRIVNRSGEKSGVWRYSNDNPGTRNYYLVVEALDGAGKATELPIRNEENGETQRVSVFAVRVPEEEYNRVGADKKDNGIIEQDVIGKKARGALTPRFDIPTAGGYITAW